MSRFRDALGHGLVKRERSWNVWGFCCLEAIGATRVPYDSSMSAPEWMCDRHGRRIVKDDLR